MKRDHRNVTLAEHLFSARRELDRYEEMLYDILEERVGMVFEDTRFDPYDQSLELDACQSGVRLSKETQDKIYELGFMRVWLNHLDGWETYYYKGGDPVGYRKIKGR